MEDRHQFQAVKCLNQHVNKLHKLTLYAAGFLPELILAVDSGGTTTGIISSSKKNITTEKCSGLF